MVYEFVLIIHNSCSGMNSFKNMVLWIDVWIYRRIYDLMNEAHRSSMLVVLIDTDLTEQYEGKQIVQFPPPDQGVWFTSSHSSGLTAACVSCTQSCCSLNLIMPVLHLQHRLWYLCTRSKLLAARAGKIKTQSPSLDWQDLASRCIEKQCQLIIIINQINYVANFR